MLSLASKTAYVTGLWDGYLAFLGDDLLERYKNSCGEKNITRVSDIVEVLDRLYELKINRGFSPAVLLRGQGLQYLCSN